MKKYKKKTFKFNQKKGHKIPKEISIYERENGKMVEKAKIQMKY